jgi:ABC-2 type transport system ATP-binding protein
VAASTPEAATGQEAATAAEAVASTTAPPKRPATRTPAARKPAGPKPAAPKPAGAKPAGAPKPAVKAASRPRRKPVAKPREVVLRVTELSKRFDQTVAVDAISLSVPVGSIFGLVGPNGAGKTTTLSMVTGLLRPDSGTVTVHGADVWSDPVAAKRNMGVLPDRLRLFDRLTGSQLLFYAGTLRGLDAATVRRRSADLAAAFGLEGALGRLVADYSAGMTKKVALACAMIHSPRLLVLDEPFEAVDPVSAATITGILQDYVKAGGTVVLSSHSMDLIQRMCDFVAVVVSGEVLISGTTDEVRGQQSLEERFVELAGGRPTTEGLEWLHSFSD